MPGTNVARAILAFKAWATPSGGAFAVEVNDSLIYDPTMSGGDVRGLWEVRDATVLSPGIVNTFQFRATVNKIGFSDVALWFQFDV